MGLIKSIKKIFSNDIVFDVSKKAGLVTPVQLKHSHIKIDSKVYVPENYCFVLGHNGKCLDMFTSGEYYLSAATLPECCKKLKIHKPDKNNKVKKSFKADAYYVCMQDFVLNFKTLDKAELGGKASGIFSVGLKCDIKLKAYDVKKLMDALLNAYAYLRPNEAEKIIVSYASDFVISILNDYNFALSEFINSNKLVVDNLIKELKVKFDKMGLILIDITNVRYLLPKKHQKEYENNLKQLQSRQEQEKPVKKSDDDYVPYGNFVIEEIEQDKNVILKETKQQESEAKKTEAESEEFVDLNLDNLYNTKKKGKSCVYCGFVNTSTATVCELCGNALENKGE